MTLTEIAMPPLSELLRRLVIAEYPVLREGLIITLPDPTQGSPPSVTWQLGNCGGSVLVKAGDTADEVIHNIVGGLVGVVWEDRYESTKGKT